MKIKLGLPSKVVQIETGKVIKQYPPYREYELALFSKNKGITTNSYDTQEHKLRYPHGIVFGKLGAKFAGYIT